MPSKPRDALDVFVVAVSVAAAGDVAGDVDIALRSQRRQQVELLEDKTDFRFSHARPRRIGQRGEVDAIDQHPSRSRRGSSRPGCRTSVDLPLPDGPTMLTNSPFSTSSETPRNAGTSTLPMR